MHSPVVPDDIGQDQERRGLDTTVHHDKNYFGFHNAVQRGELTVFRDQSSADFVQSYVSGFATDVEYVHHENDQTSKNRSRFPLLG